MKASPQRTNPGALALAALLLGLGACGGAPEPGEPGYSYNVDGAYDAELVGDDGAVYTGTMQLETLPGGEVAGTMTISSPMRVEGTVEGLVIGAEVSLSVTFELPDQGCGGVVSGSGVVAEGGGEVTGSFLDVTDDCGGAPSALAFTLLRS